MKPHYLGCICLVILLSSFTASAKKSKGLYDCNGKIAEAINDYNLKKYSKAKSILNEAKLQCGGIDNMDTILYYLGMSYYQSKQYIEARSELERIVSDYPDHPLFQDAKFRVGMCVFKQSHPSNRDQKETLEAIGLFKDFLETNPTGPVADSVKYYLNIASEKMAQKEYDNARFYERLSEYDAAVVYYKTFIGEYPDSKFCDQAKLSLSQLLINLERKAEASDAITDLLSTAKDPLIIAKAKELQVKCK